ncbi:MAG: toll/interleukin-1 receptor domain-containing protein [Verrucomicrobia bacterium]|nr:toll/interleukin-1 receptor domain-containing protein [Verrucomicrobiota bacterium]
MPDEFQYDVFVSHSGKDKTVVRAVAERLRKDGLRVWFDEWEISVASVCDRRGDARRSQSAATVAKTEEDLEHSRVLVLWMAANAFGSDWAQLRTHSQLSTFNPQPTTAPLNRERRFIPGGRRIQRGWPANGKSAMLATIERT